MLEFYTTLLPTQGTIFDIGAHQGEYTRIFLELGYKVVAVEPLEYYYEVLNQTFSEEIETEKLVVSKHAVYKQSNLNLELNVSSINPTISTINKEFIDTIMNSNPLWSSQNWDTTQWTKSITLDDLIKKHGPPVFCKIDVEGSEYLVFQGLSTPLSLISFEYIPGFVKSALCSIDHLNNLSKDQNSSYVFNYSKGSDFSFVLQDWIEVDRMKDVIKNLNSKENQSGDIYAKLIR